MSRRRFIEDMEGMCVVRVIPNLNFKKTMIN